MDFLAAPVLSNEFVRLEPLSAAHRADLVDAVRVGNVWEAWYTHIPSPDEMSGVVTVVPSRLRCTGSATTRWTVR